MQVIGEIAATLRFNISAVTNRVNVNSCIASPEERKIYKVK